MLYNKRPNLGHLKEWGCKVWVHSKEGSKLDGRSNIGKWIGFDEPSNAHWIYWPEKRSVTVERSIKFDENDTVLVPIVVVKPIQGEKIIRNQQRDSSADERRLEDQQCIVTNVDDPKNTLTTSQQPDIPNQYYPDPINEDPPNQVLTDESEPVTGRSRRLKMPSRYIQEIQEGIGAADNCVSRPKFSTGMQIPEPKNLPKEDKNLNTDGQIERAMAAAISKIEAVDPQSLEEARRRPDWKKWELAI